MGLAAVSATACSSSKAVKLTVWHDVCVTGWDRIELDISVEEGSIVWSSSKTPEFLSGGPEDIAIAVDVDVERIDVDAVAWAGDRRVGSRSRSIDLAGESYVEEEITLEGCRCGSRDAEYCEPFEGMLDFGWGEACNCSGNGDNCENTFLVEEPASPRIYGDALHLVVGADGPDSEPCALIRPMGDAMPDTDLYLRAFVRVSGLTDPGFEYVISFLSLWSGSGEWWWHTGGLELPTLEAVTYWEDFGGMSEVMEVTLDTGEPIVPLDQWFCMGVSMVGGELFLTYDGTTYPLRERDGGTTTVPMKPDNWDNLEIEVGAPRLWINQPGLEIWVDEVAFDFYPLPCPDPADL